MSSIGGTAKGEATSARSDASVVAYLAFLGVLLATGIDIALPAFDAIEEGLDTTSNMSLIITVYFVGMALGQLVYGPVADRFGRRPAILSGLVLYLLGAAASALAPSFGALLAARLLWGLGAAAPAGLRSAITRDLYSGDAMARITTIVMAVFLLGPIFTPLLGEVILRVAPWQTIFWFAGSLALIGAAWCVRFGETLADGDQRPLAFAPLRDALKVIVRTRITLGYMAGNVFMSAAFFIFLGSSQPVFDQVYDRSSQFAVLFALSGLFAVGPLLVNNRLITRFGSRRMSLVTTGISVIVSAAAIVPTVASDGRPSFWLWYSWLLLSTAMMTMATPTIPALALEPMGELAGTASSLLFFTAFAFGAGLAAIFDAMVETTVTPFVIGFVMYTAIGFVLLWWAGRELDLARTGSVGAKA